MPGSEVRRRAVGALASVGGDEAFAQLLELWPDLDAREWRAALTELLSGRDGAARVLAALTADDIALESLDGIAWARLEEHVGAEAAFGDLRARAAEGRLRCVRPPAGPTRAAPLS